MTTLVCENTTLSDAVTKAARVAPTKGVPYDKAQGVLLDVQPPVDADPGELFVVSNDLDSTYKQRTGFLEMSGPTAQWRLPSGLLAGFLAQLPMSAGKTVKVWNDEAGMVYLQSGKAKAKFRSIIDPMPAVSWFDPDGMTRVPNLASRIDQVSWCVANDHPPLTGVYVSGTELVGCDRFQLVTMPCDVPVPHPIAVPLSKLGVLLRNLGDVDIRVTDERLQIMPDPDTQMTCARYQDPYPDIGLMLSRWSFDHEFIVSKSAIVEVLERMLVLVQSERYPKARLRFRKDDVLELRIELPRLGVVQDEVPFTHDGQVAFEMWLDPKKLLGAVQHASRESLTLATELDAMKPIQVTDGTGYRAVVTPTREDA